MTPAAQMVQHHGGCHCGLVRFTVWAPTTLSVSQCNCSVCAASGHLGLIVPRDRFTLETGEEHLTEYTFNTGTAKHLFCKHCGIKSFYVPCSHPDGISVNARCLDSNSRAGMTITEFDGQNWEKHYPKGRAETYPE